MSFHLTYLTMSAGHSHAERQSVLDQSPLLSMHIGRQDKNLENQYLYKTSFSTLLTIVIPEESRNREEEIDLLKSPQGLWTVLMINYPQLDSHKELDTHLTPVSQFIRGMTAAIITQRHNAESIVDFLRLELQSCDSAGLFDDKNFTKSNTYHRTIQACNELKDSLDSTARFMAKLIAGQLKELRSVVHRDEKPGVEHWSRRMQEELFSLKEITAQVEGLNRRAQESVREP